MIARQTALPVDLLAGYQQQLQQELHSILDYWTRHTQDTVYGGFYGSVDNNDLHDPAATKGIVMNSRICWAFSAA